MADTTKTEFFDYLRNITTKDVIFSAIPEGTVVFPKTPLIRVEGPLAGRYFVIFLYHVAQTFECNCIYI